MPKVIGFDPVDLGFGGMINYSGSDNNKVLDDVRDGDYPTLFVPESFRYLRLEIVTGSYFELTDLRFIASLTRYPTVNMTTNSAPSPLVASASSTHLGGSPTYPQFDAFNAFDASSSSRWHSTTGGSHWIQIDLGTGNEIRPNSLAMTVISGSGDRRPTSLIVKGSNTGAFSGEDETLYTSAAGVESEFSYGVETVLDF